MYRLIITLFIIALIAGCGQEAEETAGADTTNGTEEMTASSDASTVKDKVSDSEYSKKYGAAMKEAMASEEEPSEGEQ